MCGGVYKREYENVCMEFKSIKIRSWLFFFIKRGLNLGDGIFFNVFLFFGLLIIFYDK